jgi:hypothetical protein
LSEVARAFQIKLIKRSALTVWLFCLILAALVLGQYRLRTLHPPFLPEGVLLFGLAVTLVTLLASALVEILVSKHRLNALKWLLFGLLPVGLLAIPLEYAREAHERKEVPHNWLMGFSEVFAAALMDGQALVTLPNKLETERLVMYYKELPHPQQDINAMDANCARLEKLLNMNLRAKIHWFRGTLLGQSGASFMGMALGSSGGTDADLDEQGPFEADPPMVFHDGWAESQSGISETEAAHEAWKLKESGKGLSIVELLSEKWYHQDSGPVYTIGGPFARFFIRKYGADRFRDYYNRARPGNATAFSGHVAGPDFKSIEKEFWADTRKLAERF